MNLNHFYHYYKSKSGGVSNLLKASEDFTSSLDWLKKPDTDAPTITGGVTDPNGGTDAQRVNFTANRQSRVQQSVTLSASTQYTFSVYARVNTGTDQFRLRNVTLSAAEAKTATTSWTRFEYTFTTTTGGVYELSIQNTENVAANIEFFGAMLNVGASANDYVKVDPSTGGSAPTPAYSGFGDVFGGATAYYSLRKFTEAETLNAIRVRRSSDDTEQDIGFDSNGDLDTTALLAFVNEDITQYNYSTATQMVADFASVGGAESVDSVGGEEGLKFTINASSGTHFPYRFNVFGGSGECSISFDYYLPSTNTDIDGIQMSDGSNDIGATQTTQDAWTSITVSGTLGGTAIYIFSKKGATKSFTGNGTDVFYIKNLVVTQTTADGAVTTWYDQSGNGNDATNSTESEQPLVVSAGTLVTMGGASKAAIEGSSSSLALTTALTPTNFSIIHTSEGTGFAVNIDEYIRISNYYRYNIGGNNYISSDSNAAQQSIYVGNRNGTTLNLRRNGSEMSGSPYTSVTTALNITTIFNRSSLYFVGKMSEIIIFESDQSSNLTGISSGIEGNIDTYFDIV
jgi:hypothetical protein